MRRQRIFGVSLAAAIGLALVSCHGTDAQFTVGGTISGTNGPVVLRLNGENDITQNGDGDFTFTQKLLQDDTFNVQIANPTGRCTVQNGAGTVAQSNVKDVNISCVSYATDPSQLLKIVVRASTLSGARVNQPVTTSATAVGGVIVDPTDKDPITGNVRIFGGLVLSGLTSPLTDVAIFQAPSGHPGDNGLAILHLFVAADGVTAVVPPDSELDSNALASLFAGELYFNVSTATNLNGELRGAIELQGGLAASVPALDNTQVVPPTSSTAFGVGVLIVDRATRKILISYIQHTVVAAAGAGISTSQVPAGPILAFGNLQSNIDTQGTNLATPTAGAVLTETNLTDFDGSFLYFRVASGAPPSDEIRGNISPLPQ